MGQADFCHCRVRFTEHIGRGESYIWRVKRANRTIDAFLSTVINPWQQVADVDLRGTLPALKSVELLELSRAHQPARAVPHD